MGTRRDFLKAAAPARSPVRRSRLNAALRPRRRARAASAFQSPELVSLYETYTAGPTSIGADLTRMTVKAGADDPLIVATGTDMAIFPGGGRPPKVQSFRLSTRGFKELAGIAHFGPALASIVNMHALEPANDIWRKDAERLAAATQAARNANSASLWRDRIAVEAFRGREDAIAAWWTTPARSRCAISRRCSPTRAKLDARLPAPGLSRGEGRRAWRDRAVQRRDDRGVLSGRARYRLRA